MQSRSKRASLTHALGIGLFAWTLILLLPSTSSAQARQALQTFSGGWTLNGDQSAVFRPLEPPAEKTSDRPAGSGSKGSDRGDHGGPGNGKPGENKGGGWDGEESGPDPAQLRAAIDLANELSTQARHLSIAIDGQTITLEDAQGHSTSYVASNKKEQHQLAGGTVEARTKLEKAELRQEFKLPAGVKLTRAFSLSPDGGALVVTTALTGLPRDSGRSPIRSVYDRDAAR